MGFTPQELSVSCGGEEQGGWGRPQPQVLPVLLAFWPSPPNSIINTDPQVFKTNKQSPKEGLKLMCLPN